MTMFGTTSSLCSAQLVANVPPRCAVVKVIYTYKKKLASQIVVVGPNEFQLCTCLRVLRCRLPCQHALAALVTQLGRGIELASTSIHPRWLSALDPWSIGTSVTRILQQIEHLPG